MKREELKKALKPLVRECIKEVLFEEGSLSTIISEVMKVEFNNKQSITEDVPRKKQVQSTPVNVNKRLNEQKKMLLDAIGSEAYNGVNLFEGTTPTRAAPQQGAAPSGALSGMDPGDAGVDISSLAGMSSTIWKKMNKGK
jgi:hypothetical protein